MTVRLHSDFLNSPESYGKAIEFWENLWDDLICQIPHDYPWSSPWMENSIPDGNPIFSAVSQFQKRGIRIIQLESGDPGDIDLDWWLDYYGDRKSRNAIRELVIACCPSKQNIQEVERILREWVELGEIKNPAKPLSC